MQPFDGEITNWTPFWDSFRAAVHENKALSDVDKFNYLRGLLQRSALESISGLALTEANYHEAIAVLKKRFGNKPQIIAKHMDALIHVDSVTSPQNIKGLRRLHDLVESNVRSLKSLGVDSSSYGSLLASVLITKLPQELQLIVSRASGGDDWNLDNLMANLEKELQARERTAAVPAATVKRSKDLPCAATLFTGERKKLTCSYCQQPHPSNTCGIVTQPHARKQMLQKAGQCFICLRRGHVSKKCDSGKRCGKCSGRHHISICTRGVQSEQGIQSTSKSTTVNRTVASNQPIQSASLNPQPGLNVTAPPFQSDAHQHTTRSTPARQFSCRLQRHEYSILSLNTSLDMCKLCSTPAVSAHMLLSISLESCLSHPWEGSH